MKSDDIVELFEDYERKHGEETYKYTSVILEEARKRHKADLKGSGKNFKQSWRKLKGKMLEKLIHHILLSPVENLGLKAILDDELSAPSLEPVKRNLLINYNEFGYHLPDADIVIYNPKSYVVVCIISSKTSARERVAQTCYWKLKLEQDSYTKHIRVYFMTTDEGKKLNKIDPYSKPRAIVESDLDGSYAITQEKLPESKKVKLFEHFLEDLKALVTSSEELQKLFEENSKRTLLGFM